MEIGVINGNGISVSDWDGKRTVWKWVVSRQSCKRSPCSGMGWGLICHHPPARNPDHRAGGNVRIRLLL